MHFQKEFVNLNKRKTSNDVDNNQTAAIPSITDKEKRDELRVSTFMMTQEFVTEKGICQNDPNVTTALLTDCPGMGEHEMSVLKPNENGNETTLTTKDASDAMNSINHTQVQLTHDGGCKPEKGQNGFHSQDDLVKVVTTGKCSCCHTHINYQLRSEYYLFFSELFITIFLFLYFFHIHVKKANRM